MNGLLCAHVLFLLWRGSLSAFIASSQVEHCLNDGTTPEPQNCTLKFTVALTVSNDQNNTESVAVFKSATDENGVDYTLLDPIELSLQKTEAQIRYPIYYQRDFNSKPEEEIVATGMFGCKDGEHTEDTTCPPAFANGERIPYSQGFCCNCDMLDILQIQDSDIRANLHCSFSVAASAHCLRFGEYWYSAFQVGPAETWYNIILTVKTKKETKKYSLGPGNTGINTGDVLAKLIGDFAAFSEPVGLEHVYFLVPSLPTNNDRYQAGSAEWMFIDKTRFTMTGSECDKIGTSYEAFFAQPQKCVVHKQTCLKGQIDDLRDEDLQKRNMNRKGNYFVDNFGDFKAYEEVANSKPSSQRASSGNTGALKLQASPQPKPSNPLPPNLLPIPQTGAAEFGVSSLNPQAKNSKSHPQQAQQQERRFYVAYTVTEKQDTLLTLTFSGDKIAFVTNLASGDIVAVNISNFEAFSKDGQMQVTVFNSGRINADFYVAVQNCDKGVDPIQEQQATISAAHIYDFYFDVRVDVADGTDYACNVTLKDSLMNIIDHQAVNFTTNTLVIDKASQGGEAENITGRVLTPSMQADNKKSCWKCPFYNPICFLGRKCFAQILIQIGTFIGVVVGIIVFIKCGGAKLVGYCCRSLFHCNSGGSRSRKPHKTQKKHKKTPKRKEKNADTSSEGSTSTYTSTDSMSSSSSSSSSEEEDVATTQHRKKKGKTTTTGPTTKTKKPQKTIKTKNSNQSSKKNTSHVDTNDGGKKTKKNSGGRNKNETQKGPEALPLPVNEFQQLPQPSTPTNELKAPPPPSLHTSLVDGYGITATTMEGTCLPRMPGVVRILRNSLNLPNHENRRSHKGYSQELQVADIGLTVWDEQQAQKFGTHEYNQV